MITASQPGTPIETTSEYSFPITSLALAFSAGGAVLKAAGARSVQYLGPNNAAYLGLIELTKTFLQQVGIAFKGNTTYPPTATDYTQYVQALYGSGADGVYPLLVSAGTLPAFVNAVTDNGFSFDEVPTVFSGALFTPSVLKGQLKDKLNGVYILNAGQTPTDTSLPGIKTYHDEIDAAGTPTDYTDSGLEAWVGVHVIAQVLEKATSDVTMPATLIAAMKAVGPIDYPGWTPFDWSKPALPAALAKNFPRYFNSTFWVSKIVDNQVVSVVDKPVQFTGPVTLSK